MIVTSPIDKRSANLQDCVELWTPHGFWHSPRTRESIQFCFEYALHCKPENRLLCYEILMRTLDIGINHSELPPRPRTHKLPTFGSDFIHQFLAILGHYSYGTLC
jgi:hypothetical protein